MRKIRKAKWKGEKSYQENKKLIKKAEKKIYGRSEGDDGGQPTPFHE